jgi:lipopolysaccharide transport system ATP-binding protein
MPTAVSPQLASHYSNSAPLVAQLIGVSKSFDLDLNPLSHLWRVLAGTAHTSKSVYRALQEVSLDVPRGTSIGIVGKNGAGKSTLLQLLCGTLLPSTGQVQVFGRLAALLELGSGFNPEFTGRQNVELNARLLGMTTDELKTVFEQICAFAELGDFIDRPVKTYSSGMFVRLAFAVVVHSKADLLVVDEALAVGDARFQAKCLARLKTMREQGVTTILVSHDVSAVRQLCDMAIWLDGGKIVMQGDVALVTSEYTKFMFAGVNTEQVGAVTQAKTGRKTEPNGDAPASVTVQGTIGNGLAELPIAQWLDSKSVLSRWGIQPNCIEAAVLLNNIGQPCGHVDDHENMCIVIAFHLPTALLSDAFAVSMAVKDTRGHDLMVISTWDTEPGFYAACLRQGANEQSRVAVRFQLSNRLNQGSYVLVVALEDRSQVLPQYYDFIEGAKFFDVHRSTPRMGQFIPLTSTDFELLPA